MTGRASDVCYLVNILPLSEVKRGFSALRFQRLRIHRAPTFYITMLFPQHHLVCAGSQLLLAEALVRPAGLCSLCMATSMAHGRCCRNPHKSVHPCAACFPHLVSEMLELFAYKAQAAAVQIRFCHLVVCSACVDHLSIREFHQPPRAPTASKVFPRAIVPALTRLKSLPMSVPGFLASINSDRHEIGHFLLWLTGIQNHLASPT